MPKVTAYQPGRPAWVDFATTDAEAARAFYGTGAVVWKELQSADLAAATTFYSEVFGYTGGEEDTGEGGAQYRTFSVAGDLAGGAMQLSSEQAGGRWLPYFGVQSTDLVVASARDAEADVVAPAMDSPYGRLAVLRDPKGGVLAVLKIGEPAA